MIKKTVSDLLAEVFPQVPFAVEIPANPDHGDFAVATFALAKALKKNAKSIAEDLAKSLADDTRTKDKISCMSVGGFLNFRLTDAYLAKLMATQKPDFPKSNEKVLLEYVSANPTGPLHVGHGRWAVLGHVVESLLRYTGVDVDSEFYINDAGNQVELFHQSVKAAREGREIPENGYRGAYIHDLAKLDSDPLLHNISLQKETLERLGIRFTHWYSEKSLHDKGMVRKTIRELQEKGYTYNAEGALWFKSQSLGDEKDRVLVKSDDQLTYFAVDIAYHEDKIKRGYNRLINIWGADHHGYVARVRAGVMALCGSEFGSKERFTVLIGQLVSLKRGGEPVRMSKRTGEIITLDEVIDEIGEDATRFFLIQKSADTHLEFDLELAKKKSSENPVFYIQYAHARICSLFEKAQAEAKPKSSGLTKAEFNSHERRLLLECLHLYDEIDAAARHLAPHRIANYAQNVARLFHLFYENCPVLDAPPEERNKRLAILGHAREVLRTCFQILGISAPEKM